MSLEVALAFVRFWARKDGDFANSQARGWWFMVESIRYDSDILKELALLLLMMKNDGQ